MKKMSMNQKNVLAMTPLDMYDEYPEDMIIYLRNNGWNFSEKACDFAASKFHKKGFEPTTKEKVDALLKKEGISLEND